MRDKQVSLYCTEGGSDKVYTLWIEEKDGLFTVQALGGRRGGSMTPYTKGKPGSRPEAEKTYASVLKEKLGKGYHEGADAPAFSHVEDAVDTDLRPMLLTDASGEDPEPYLKDPSWGAQQKMNGKRIMIRTTARGVIGANRRGLECPIPEIVRTELAYGDADLDGEMIGDTYHAFDLLEMGGTDCRKDPYQERHAELEAWRPTLDHFKVVPLVTGEKAKRALYAKLQADRQEGIVFKKLEAAYLSGRVENLKKAIAIKIKFYSEGSFLVTGWTKGKSSVAVALVDPKTKEQVPAGSVTVAQKYVEQVEAGKIIRVRYLYATDANQLYQPTLDPDGNGSVVADGGPDAPGTLKHEGKD
jgi:bifunctional non-homologous end joining protein LigD